MTRLWALLLITATLWIWPAVTTAQSSTASGISRALNPAISVNGLFWGLAARDDDSAENNGIYLQEAEFRFTSIVDPYWKADVTVALHPVHDHSGEGDDDVTAIESHGLVIDLEEAYVDGRQLPLGLGLRLGKFYLPFGKQAPLHTHQWAFARQPLAVRAFIGDHGLTEVGGWLAYGLPLPWYNDLKVYGVGGTTDPPFDAASRDLSWGGRWDNLWDLGEESTLGLGGSFLQGPSYSDSGANRKLNQWGVDLTYKWISSRRSRGPALNIGAEVILPRPEQRSGDPWGWFLIAQYRVHRNWWLSGSYGIVDEAQPVEEHDDDGDHDDDDAHDEGEHHDHGFGKMAEYKFQLTYAASEFSFIRAEVNYFEDLSSAADDPDNRDDLMFIIQFDFTIGSHPAHLY